MLRSVLAALLAALLVACGVNPVTGEKELQIVSAAQEVATGQQHYLPSRQAQGGDLVIDPALTRYVQGVTARLAAVADRKELPYEVVVLASGVPNAWALPGGKLAVNRGLLLELQDEAELAAVIGHEIVHAAARHGAKAMERGMLSQVGLAAVALGVGDEKHGDLIVGGAQLGLALVTTRYGREAELESDKYGTEYLKAAGYDPQAAVTLQETFVRLSQGKRQDFLSGLFASHPPSQERVAANTRHAARLGVGGDRGRERYQAAIAGIVKSREAYALYDKGVAALRTDAVAARTLAEQAIAKEPRESLFYALKGHALTKANQRQEALRWYDQAIERNPAYFEYWLARGLTRKALGDATGSRTDLEQANKLLPTAAASEALGAFALAAGDSAGAERLWRAAAGSSAPEGQRAAANLARLMLARDPADYFATRADLDPQGRVVITVQNRAPVAVADLALQVVRVDPKTRQQVASLQVRVPNRLAAGASARIVVAMTLTDAQQLKGVRARVQRVRVLD
jgi:predicted Zn-dependent protease